jgi:hypothetical protein
MFPTMSKRTSDFRTRDFGLPRGESGPPPLSEDLIAKLQKAVSAAQRNRMAQPQQNKNRESTPDTKKSVL